MPRTIVIVEVADNDFTVIEGEGCIPRLCWDEVLPIIAKLLIVPDKKILRKIESYYEIEARLREEIREEIYAQLRPVDILTLASSSRR